MPNTTFFNKMCDELVAFSEYDPELKKGLAWLDKEYMKNTDMTFYEKVHDMLYKHDVNEKAKEWLNNK